MILERLKEYIDYKGLSISAFEKSIGMANASFGKSLKRNGAIGTDKLENILNTYPDISPSWILFGEGKMLRKDEENTTSVTISIESGVPYYNVDFIGGFDNIFNNQTTCPTHNIVFEPYSNATLWCNITGRSMEPKINNGDIIALKECTLDDVQYGEIYAVVMDTIRTVKILRKSTDPNKLRFVPVNIDSFDEQEFDKSRIIKVYEVLGCISRFF